MIKHILVIIVVMKYVQRIIRIESKLIARILSKSRSVLNDDVLYQFVSC
jgi:hypothetical protein